MKLIIDIPEIFYQNEKENTGYVSELKRNIVWDAMIKGTPLVEQEPILDNLRAEINAIEISGQIDEHTLFARSADGVKNMVLEIIDRYRNEVGE